MMDDTTPEAKRYYFDLLRNATPQFRAEKVHSLSAMVKSISMNGIRMRHPDYTDEQMKFAYLRLIMGKQSFEKAFPSIQVNP